MTLLRQFVQISDLHLTDTDPITGMINPTVGLPAFFLKRCFSGLWGHSDMALDALEKFMTDFEDNARRASEPCPELIVTGDLTASGSERQFAMANSYLSGEIPGLNGNVIGLRRGRWTDLAVPGNHDRWGGGNLPSGKPDKYFYRTFPREAFPQVRQERLMGSTKYKTTFILIDTDADVRPLSPKQLMARGHFNKHLRTINASGAPPLQQLPRREPGELRIMILHHSLKYRGKSLEISSASRVGLEAFLIEHEIPILLCGHTHVPMLSRGIIRQNQRQIETLESCCGSTTQDDHPPVSFRKLLRLPLAPRSPIPPPNSLIVHKLHSNDDGTLRWTSAVHILEVDTFKDHDSSGPFDVKHLDISV